MSPRFLLILPLLLILTSPLRAEERSLEERSRSVTLVKNEGKVIPLSPDPDDRIVLLSYGTKSTDPLLARLRSYLPIEAVALQPATPVEEREALLGRLEETDRLLLLVASTDGNLPTGACLDSLLRTKKSVLLLLDPPETEAYRGAVIAADAIALSDYSEEGMEALADAVMGGILFAGRYREEDTSLFPLGAGLPGGKTRLAPALPEEVGLDRDLPARIDAIAREGVERGAYPGCQVLVARRGYIVYSRAFGYKDGAHREPNSTATLYDLASMTKAIATAPLVMMADEEGHLDLRDRIDKHLDYMSGTNKGDVRVAQLLRHAGGMPAVLHFYEELIDEESYTPPLLSYARKRGYPTQIDPRAWARAGFTYKSSLVSSDSSALFPHRFAQGLYLSPQVREGMRRQMADCPRRHGDRYRYSDIDFLLLQDILEVIYGEGLEQLFDSRLARPLGISRLCYRPYRRFSLTEIAEGQRDDFLRRQTLRGDVDDEAAAMLGGVSGNAGLFGNAESCAVICQMLLNEGSYGGRQLIGDKTVRHYTRYRHPSSPYALGFDRQRGKGTGNTCEEASPTTYGHTGFTGTCFWIDPEEELIYIFLSNRGAPVRWNSRLSSLKIRKRIQSALYEAIR